MTKLNRITPEQIRQTNRHIIYRHIYTCKGSPASQHDISSALRMSRPTVAGILSEMEGEGLIFRSGTIDAGERGRKAATWSVNAACKIAVGVEILRRVVKIIAIDLYGQPLKCEKFFVEYENSASYYEAVSRKVKDFIGSLDVDNAAGKILGIGFALQGLVSEDGNTVIYGEILKCTGLKIDVFTRWLDYPCKFIHEPDGAALSELWVSPELDNAVYLSMSEHLGGALISGRKILNGTHRHSATFEHITACNDGELCYCGKRGCFETVCSKVALLRGEAPDDFFGNVRSGDPEASHRWRVFLEYLGKLIANLHLLVDTKYILGGHLAPYFNEEDIRKLYDYVREHTPFIEEDDYILPSKMPSHNITIGAALPYIMNFLDNI